MKKALGPTISIMVLGFAAAAQAAPCASPYVTGNVFASVSFATVDVFTPTGTLICTLNDTSGGQFTTGSGFDASGNLYVTNFDAGTISKFNNSGTLLNSSFMSSNNTPESIDIQTTGSYAGTSLVGGPGFQAHAAIINQFDTSTGALVHSYTVSGGFTGTFGADWVDTYNPTTGQVIYLNEGSKVLSAILNSNGTVTQLADFSSAATEATLAGNVSSFALRTIPSGTFAGDVLLANNLVAVLLDASGNIIDTYTLPGNPGLDFALNLDPNGIDFWTASSFGNVWEVNIATGTIDEQWSTGSDMTFGLAVFGELQEGGPPGGGPPTPTSVPEPASLILLGSGLAGLRFLRRKRKVS